MRVLVNGCSHIEGTGLHADPQLRKTLSWPNSVSTWAVQNIAEPASSNDSICRRTIDFLNHTSDYFDFVYVQWSYFDRIELQIPFWQEHGLQKEWFCINPANAQQKMSLNGHEHFVYDVARSVYLNQFNSTWLYHSSLKSITTLYHYLVCRGIEFRFGFAFDTLDQSDHAWFDQRRFIMQPWVDFCTKNQYPRGADNAHYGQDAHNSYSKYIEGLISCSQ